VPEAPTIGSTISWFDTSTLVYVPGGEFVMGADEPEKQDFNPAHPVDVAGFWIYSTKVTNEMYNLCVSLGQCTPTVSTTGEPGATLPGTSLVSYFTGPDDNGYSLKDLPVTNVTWDQADNYCKWVGGRLPTEAEWEKTARGEESKIQPWGDEPAACNFLNFKDCAGLLSSVLDHPEGISDYMALDMAGNAYEWVNDWYQKDYYPQSPASNPTGPVDGEKRSVRGSSFDTGLDYVISAQRSSLEPDQSKIDVGFRCVIEDPTVFAPICEAPAQAIPESSLLPLVGTPVSVSDDSSASLIPINLSLISIKSNSFCANQSANLGGATFKTDFTAFFKEFASCNTWWFGYGVFDFPKNISSSFQNDKYIFSGPEGTTFEWKAEVACVQAKGNHFILQLNPFKVGFMPSPDVPATCKLGFTLQPDGKCQYSATTNQPASVSCPGGYAYNEDTQCCTQIPPQSSAQLAQYSACGAGSIFDPQKNVCYKPNGKVFTFPVSTLSFPVKLGTCDEPKPKDSDKPSQPQQPEPTPTFCDPATGACP
jgi:formylglycine-generating enzyme required for sulfatase activity